MSRRLFPVLVEAFAPGAALVLFVTAPIVIVREPYESSM